MSDTGGHLPRLRTGDTRPEYGTFGDQGRNLAGIRPFPGVGAQFRTKHGNHLDQDLLDGIPHRDIVVRGHYSVKEVVQSVEENNDGNHGKRKRPKVKFHPVDAGRCGAAPRSGGSAPLGG